MPNKTVLTARFPTSGFHHYTTDELVERLNNFPQIRRLTGCTWIHPDYLPQTRFKNKIIRFHLLCIDAHAPGSKLNCPVSEHLYQMIRESPPRETSWDPHETLLENRGSVSTTCVYRYLPIDGNSSGIELEGADVSNLKFFLHDNKPGEIVFNLKIGLLGEYFGNPLASDELTDLRKCERKEWFAMELIIGYRRITKVLAKLMGRQSLAENDSVVSFHSPELHPSIKGAWRLVCKFSSIRQSLEVLQLWERFRKNCNLETFLAFIDEDPKSYKEYIRYWCHEKRVKPHVIEKRTIEFFIHQDILRRNLSC